MFMDKYKIIFSNNLTYLRIQKGLSQDELSTIIGISQQTIGYYETSDSSNPKMTTLIKLSKLFNISLDDLITKDITT